MKKRSKKIQMMVKKRYQAVFMIHIGHHQSQTRIASAILMPVDQEELLAPRSEALTSRHSIL